MLATKTKLKPYVELIKKKTLLEEQLRDVKARLDELEPQIAESWSFLVRDNVNTQQLSARVRECELDVNGMPILPDELKQVIKVSEVFRIGARKSG